ncbi:MAG: hypothetical protein ACRBB6_12725 [Neptuniibacter sp.]
MKHPLILIPLLTLPISACSLFTPYVDPAKLHTKVEDSTKYPCKLTSNNDMNGALLCAQTLESEYIDNMGDQALLSSVGGVSLIALTAYTAGVAINDNHATNVTDFALGGAAIYGMNNWLSQPTRTQIYGAGAKTIQCAIDASLPFIQDTKDLQDNLAALKTARGTTKKAIDLIPLPPEENTEARKKVQKLVEVATAAVADAKTLTDRGVALQKAYSNASNTLVISLLRINSTVNEGLSGTIQSVSALPNTLSGIMDVYSGFKTQALALSSSTAESVEPPKDPLIITSEKEKSVTDLKEALDELIKAHAALELAVSTLTPELSDKTADVCNIDLSKTNLAITLNPSSLTFDAPGKVLTVMVSGGSGRYISSYDESVFNVKHIPTFGSVLQIQVAAAEAKADGSYAITVMDHNGAEQVLVVDVQLKAKTEN